MTSTNQSYSIFHNFYVMPASTSYTSFHAEMKAINKALLVIQTEESPQKVRIVSDNQAILTRIANLQTAISTKVADVCDILDLLAALNDELHQITFTWRPSHWVVVGNEMADDQARKGADANQEGHQ